MLTRRTTSAANAPRNARHVCCWRGGMREPPFGLERTHRPLASWGALALLLFACQSSTGPGTDPSPEGGADAAAQEDSAPSGDAASDAASASAFGEPCTVGDDKTCSDGLFCL